MRSWEVTVDRVRKILSDKKKLTLREQKLKMVLDSYNYDEVDSFLSLRPDIRLVFNEIVESIF